MCAAGGLNGRLGAAKRRMLSLAERLSLEVAAWLGLLPLTGTVEGIVAKEASTGGYRAAGKKKRSWSYDLGSAMPGRGQSGRLRWKGSGLRKEECWRLSPKNWVGVVFLWAVLRALLGSLRCWGKAGSVAKPLLPGGEGCRRSSRNHNRARRGDFWRARAVQGRAGASADGVVILRNAAASIFGSLSCSSSSRWPSSSCCPWQM